MIVQCFVLRIRLCSGSFCTPIVAFFLCRFSDDWLVNSFLQIYRSHIYSTTLRCRFFSEKSIEKKHFCRHDKNYHYFWKSNIPVINLIVDSRNMIKVSKNMRLEKIRSTARVVFTKYRQNFRQNCRFFENCR